MEEHDHTIIVGDCYDWLNQNPDTFFHMTFLDPPFNQKNHIASIGITEEATYIGQKWRNS
jgi:DNA modification methylase